MPFALALPPSPWPSPWRALFAVCLAVLLAGAGGGVAAWAESPAPTPVQPGTSGQGSGQSAAPQEPALLQADQLTSDESLGLVIASGRVELAQNGRTVTADTVTYNQKTRVIVASGNVRVFEPSGEVLFAEYAELTEDMKEAFLQKVRVLLTDSSRAVGTEAERRQGRYTVMNRAVYSACYPCREQPDLAPIWQIRAERAVHDNVDKDVRYRDAVVEFFGVPAFYTPYLSHPDPTVKRRDGFLAPVFGHSTYGGATVRSSYYFDIAPNKDATLEMVGMQQAGPMLGGEWRQRFEKGDLRATGSILYGPRYYDIPSATGFQRVNQGDALRGHIHGTTRFDINDAWRWGGEVNAASDRTYLQQLAINNVGYLNNTNYTLRSKLYTEGFWGRNYFGASAYRFQDLRQGAENQPFVFPLSQYAALGEPGSMMGGRWSLDAGAVGLTRRVGTDTTRVTIQPGWQREFTSGNGLITTVSTAMRGDVYRFQNLQRTPGGPDDRGSALRLYPEGQAMARYPFVRTGESSQQIIEPIVAVTAARRMNQNPVFPNEESLSVEFDDTNLFRTNRFTGWDRIEGGQHADYGVRVGTYGFNSGRASAFLGQSYRISGDRPFGASSGLDQKRSDYVGRVEVQPVSWAYANYGFRTDRDSMEPRFQNLTAALGVPALTLGTSYTFSNEYVNPINNQRSGLEFATYSLSSVLSRYWSASLSHSQSYEPDPGPRVTNLVFSYNDECLLFQTLVSVDQTTQQGAGTSNVVYFRVVLKNLGEIISPKISGG